ncbi:hypothetical protein NE237_000157 [Protea cynaroides]|uniref:Uncharacterized protein n=1 Tax=Protea cynaroides TaxID=273540 RepID=A0A9Q0GK36_9MAGN|nr:hypothetical protein NE237_000157 [Protea cynaroides]
MIPSLKTPRPSSETDNLVSDPIPNEVLGFSAEPENASSVSALVSDDAEFPPLVPSPQPKDITPPADCSPKHAVADDKMVGEGSPPRNTASIPEERSKPEVFGEVQACPLDIPGPVEEPDMEYINAWKNHDWRKVRAKKKGPDGASGKSPTRMESCKGADNLPAPKLVSNAHWRIDSLSENQSAQPALFPDQVTNSNFGACSLGVECPPNPFACLSPGLDQISRPVDPLSTTSKPDHNPIPPESSAGHTPFLARASLAGKKRPVLIHKGGPSKLVPTLVPNAVHIGGPVSKDRGSSILRSLSVSRNKVEVGGAATRKPSRLSSPPSSKILEECVGVSMASTLRAWEDDQSSGSGGDFGDVNEKSKCLNLKGKEGREEGGWMEAHLN